VLVCTWTRTIVRDEAEERELVRYRSNEIEYEADRETGRQRHTERNYNAKQQ